MTDRDLIIDALKALDAETPSSLVMVVAKSAAAMMEVDLATVAQALGVVGFDREKPTMEKVMAAIQQLQTKSSRVHTQRVLKHWATAKPRKKR